MRVFNNSQHSPANSTSSGKKSSVNRKISKTNELVGTKRLSRAEVERRFEELKNEKRTGNSLKERKQNYERSKMSQFMGGGIFKGDFRAQNLSHPKPVVVGEELELNDSPNTADYVLGSDIAANKPDAAETREKLKGVLSNGGFKFSDKERDVLSKILAD
ncbi:MAG: hypothetical protein HN576_11290 [Bacteriovoracaceae bacterium]|jgi:hypothetical protein|nr:hypothetical protein [Bacteriovoracaceae bacterium]